MEALKLEHLSKSFGGLRVLDDISLTIEMGERVVLIGPNGAGKTTLFNVINGQLPPTSGRIYLFDGNVTKLPVHSRAHRGISRSFQITSVYPNLSVLDNAILVVHGCKRSRFHPFRSINSYRALMTKAQEALEMGSLWDARNELVQSLSYGEQRRLEITLSLASEPRLLLLDEPSSGLTSSESAGIINIINELPENITPIVVAHDMDVIFGVAERIIVLYYGKLLADGTPEDIQTDPQVREIYLGAEEGKESVGAS